MTMGMGAFLVVMTFLAGVGGGVTGDSASEESESEARSAKRLGRERTRDAIFVVRNVSDGRRDGWVGVALFLVWHLWTVGDELIAVNF
jgi:hypothetical protein